MKGINTMYKVIDAHAHLVQVIAGIGSEGELRYTSKGKARYATGREFQMLPLEYQKGYVTCEDLLKKMDENNVEKAVLLQGNWWGFQNLYSYDAYLKYPTRFKVAVSYDPFSFKKEAIKKHFFEELKIKVCKFELSSGSGTMANHLPFQINNEMMMEEYKYLNDHNCILTIDIGKCHSVSWQIDNLVKICQAFPNLTIVVCHLLACSINDFIILKESLQKLKFRNVFFDLAALTHNLAPDAFPYPQSIKYIKEAIKIVGDDHLLFGSDFPSTLKDETYSNLINYIAECNDLTKKEKENILYNNSNNVYFR